MVTWYDDNDNLYKYMLLCYYIILDMLLCYYENVCYYNGFPIILYVTIYGFPK